MIARRKANRRNPMSRTREWLCIGLFLLAGSIVQLLVLATSH